MSQDDEALQAMGGLINELKKALGDEALELPAVRRAMLLISQSAWEEAEAFREEVEAPKH